jgi:hypothetical protein
MKNIEKRDLTALRSKIGAFCAKGDVEGFCSFSSSLSVKEFSYARRYVKRILNEDGKPTASAVGLGLISFLPISLLLRNHFISKLVLFFLHQVVILNLRLFLLNRLLLGSLLSNLVL